MLGKYKEILDKNKKRVSALADDVQKGFELCIEANKDSDLEKANEARSLLKDAHDRNNKIDNEIIKTLALFSPEARDLRIVISYLKIASELTRISDYVRSFAKGVKIQITSEFDMSALQNDINSFLDSTYSSLKAAVESVKISSEDKLEKLYQKVHVEESKCDDIVSILEKNIMQQIFLKPEDASEFLTFIKNLRRLERLSDRSVNIVKLSYFAHKGGKLKL